MLRLLALLLLSAPAWAQPAAPTPYPLDTTYTVVTTQHVVQVTRVTPASAPMAQQMGGERRVEVRSVGTAEHAVVRAAGADTVRIVQRRVQMEMQMPDLPQPLAVNTDDPASVPDELSALTALLGVPMTLVRQPDSVQIADLDAFVDALLEASLDDDAGEFERTVMRNAMTLMMTRGARRYLNSAAYVVPTGPIAAGDTWAVRVPLLMDNVDADLVGTVVAMSADGERIAFEGRVTVDPRPSPPGMPTRMSGSGTLAVSFDLRTGESDARQQVELVSEMDTPDGAGGTGALTLTTDLDVTQQARLR
jgi:hypothetical protein